MKNKILRRIAILRKKLVFVSLVSVCLCTWNSCSRRHDNCEYLSKNSGACNSRKYKKSCIEYTKSKYIHSKNEWCLFSKCNKNVKFLELKIDDAHNHSEVTNSKSVDYPNSIKILEVYPNNSKVKSLKTPTFVAGNNPNFIKKTKNGKMSFETSTFSKEIKKETLSQKNCNKEGRNFNDKEVTVIFIHGLGGKEGDFYNLMSNLARETYSGRVNMISGKRYDSCIKHIVTQSEEVKKKLLEYLKKRSSKKVHKIILAGHSQGGLVALCLLLKLINNQKFNIGGIVLIGTPLCGIDATKNFMDLQRKEFPHIISTVEKGIFGCSLKENPKGVSSTFKDKVKILVKKANNIILRNNIPTKVLIGVKPEDYEYPNTPFTFISRIIRLVDSNILKLKTIKKGFSLRKMYNTFKELIKGISKMKSLFNAKDLAGEQENDFLLSKSTQTWYLPNKNVKNILLKGVVHNWKISLLVSPNCDKRITAELESLRTKNIIKNMINKCLRREL